MSILAGAFLLLLAVFVLSLRGNTIVAIVLSVSWGLLAVFTQGFHLAAVTNYNVTIVLGIVFGPVLLGLLLIMIVRATPRWWTWLTSQGERKILFMLMTVPETFTINDFDSSIPTLKHSPTGLNISLASDLDDLKVHIAGTRLFPSAIAKNLINLRCKQIVKLVRRQNGLTIYDPIDRWLKTGMPTRK